MYRPCSLRAARRRGESFGVAWRCVRAGVAWPWSNSRKGPSSCRSAFEIARAFSALCIALFAPLTLLLVGIVLRGAAFTFRAYDTQSDPNRAGDLATPPPKEIRRISSADAARLVEGAGGKLVKTFPGAGIAIAESDKPDFDSSLGKGIPVDSVSFVRFRPVPGGPSITTA